MTRPRRTAAAPAAKPVALAASGWPEWVDAAAARQLRETVRDGRVGHAYLISGPRGVGKAELARAFAQAICCPQRDARDPSQPCGHCRACRAIAQRNSNPRHNGPQGPAMAVVTAIAARGHPEVR